MTTIKSRLFLSGVVGVLVLVGAIGLTTGADRGKTVRHRILKGGLASGSPAIIGYDGKIEWQWKRGDEMSDVWALADGGLVFSFSQRGRKAGIMRMDKNKKWMWTYIAVDKRDNHSCQPLPGGGFLAGESSEAGGWMVEIDAAGKKVKEIKVDLKVKDPTKTFRHVRKTKEGTYLAAIMDQNKTYEWNAVGKVIRTFPNGHYAAIRLPNGNTLISGYPRSDDMGGVTEYDKKGKIVWALTKADFERLGLSIQMICGIHRLPNGNTVFSNDVRGNLIGKVRENLTGRGKRYRLLEINRDKKLIWYVARTRFLGVHMNGFQILDVAGDPAKFEVFK